MPKGPKGQKRPADVVSNAVYVMRIATGEIEEGVTADGKNAAAVALGRLGGLARTKTTSKARIREIARSGGEARAAALSSAAAKKRKRVTKETKNRV